MKFKINKKKIISALQIINDISQKKVGDDITKNFIIHADKELSSISLRSTNFDIFYEAVISNEIEEPGELCINAGYFTSLVSKIPSDEISIESNEQKWMKLFSGKSNNKLAGVDAEFYPEIKFDTLSNNVDVLWKDFIKCIDLVYFAIGDNPVRKNLMGMNIRKEEDNNIRLTSSDGYRMLSVLMKELNVNGEFLDIIIPKKSIAELKKLNFNGDETVKLSWNERLFQIEAGTQKMKISLISAKYPDLSKLLFSDATHSAKFNAENMFRLLEVTKIYVSEMNNVVKLTFKDKTINIEGEKSEAGESLNTLDCLYDGEEMNIGLNVNFLIDALTVFGNEEIEVLFNHPDKPLLLRSKKLPDYHSIIMPIRLQW